MFLILLSELHRSGTLDDEGLARVMEKLEQAEYHDIADRVAALPLMNLLNDPSGGKSG